MIDLHTHSLFSDGELLPSELVRRAEVIGYEGIAITDHGDRSNLEWIIPRIVSVCAELNHYWRIRAVPGIELTHVPPESILELSQKARSIGAKLVVVHGETIAEPVYPGTNRKAIEARVDILAHPGLITEEEVRLAKENGVFLEISSRHGHSLTNGHVAKLALRYSTPLLLNTDTHSPENLITREKALSVARGAGLSEEDFRNVQENARHLVARILTPRNVGAKEG